MATKRKPPKKAEPIDVSARLAQALSEKQQTESHTHQDAPVVGDIVTVGTGKSELRITKVYDDGQEVNLEMSGTNLERFRVRVEDLHFVERQPRKPKEPEKPKIDVEELNERLIIAQHESVQQLSAAILQLKRHFEDSGAPPKAAIALDKFCVEVSEGWDETIGEIMKILDK